MRKNTNAPYLILIEQANYEGVHIPATNDMGYPIIVQALAPEGSAGRAGRHNLMSEVFRAAFEIKNNALSLS